MKIRSRYLTVAFGWLAAQAMRVLSWTIHINRASEDRLAPWFQNEGGLIICLWHDEIVLPLLNRLSLPNFPVAALVSRHQDGSYLAEFMKWVGIRPVRGSSGHGGSAALRELIREVARHHVFITPDGPRGPRHVIKPGILFLAAQTGYPIIPCRSAGTKGWRIPGKWTDLYIPRPFSKTELLFGAPVFVSPSATRAELETCRLALEAEMERLGEVTQALLRGEQVPHVIENPPLNDAA